jgi:hypothetical protein
MPCRSLLGKAGETGVTTPCVPARACLRVAHVRRSLVYPQVASSPKGTPSLSQIQSRFVQEATQGRGKSASSGAGVLERSAVSPVSGRSALSRSDACGYAHLGADSNTLHVTHERCTAFAQARPRAFHHCRTEPACTTRIASDREERCRPGTASRTDSCPAGGRETALRHACAILPRVPV